MQRKAAPSLRQLSGIPAKDLAVAWFGAPDKLTYLGIGEKAPLVGAILELKVDRKASSNINVNEAELRGCLILQKWEPATPMGWDERPLTDCDRASTAEYDKSSNTFQFDLGPLARSLASPGIYGISIEPVAEPKSTFQVVVKGGSSVVVNKTSGTNTQSEPPSGFAGRGNGAPSSSGGRNPGTDNFAPSFGSAPLPVPPSNDAASGELPAANAPVEPKAPVPLAASSVPLAEQRPATFVWVYVAFVGMAVCPLATRLLAYALPVRARR